MVGLDEMGPEAAKSFPGQQVVRALPPADGAQPAERARQEIDYGRRGKGYIFGAFQPATGAAFTKFGDVSIPGLPSASFPNPYNQFQLGASASWEVDLFGRVRRSVEAANADLEASVEDQHLSDRE